jgi:hypothetical protein
MDVDNRGDQSKDPACGYITGTTLFLYVEKKGVLERLRSMRRMAQYLPDPGRHCALPAPDSKSIEIIPREAELAPDKTSGALFISFTRSVIGPVIARPLYVHQPDPIVISALRVTFVFHPASRIRA